MPPPIPPNRLYAGCKLDNQRYRLIKTLGEGGNGCVWLADHLKMGSQVAIKFPKQTAHCTDLFGNETKNHVLFSNRHPHIVSILDVGEHHGRPYMVMQYLGHGTLEDRIRKNARANMFRSTQSWLTAIADALDFLHANHLIHGDVKPANILLDDSLSAYLGDLGIASSVKNLNDKDPPVSLMGSIPYLAPEVLSHGRKSAASDQYALSLSLYEFLTGVSPFAGLTPSEVVRAQMMEPISWSVPLSTFPSEVLRLIQQAAHPDEKERFGSCTEFATRIGPYWKTLGDLIQHEDALRVSKLEKSSASTGSTSIRPGTTDCVSGRIAKPSSIKPLPSNEPPKFIKSGRLFRGRDLGDKSE